MAGTRGVWNGPVAITTWSAAYARSRSSTTKPPVVAGADREDLAVELHGQVEVLRVAREVVDDLVAAGIGVGVARKREAGQAVVAHGREQLQRVPPLAPRRSRRVGRLENREAAAVPGQEVPERQPCLAAADHDDVVAVTGGGHDARLRLDDVEAEHHAALVVLGDVAVRHPAAGVGDLEQDVDRLAGADEHRVAPHEVRLDLAVAGEDEEPPGTVDVERVVHRVVGVHLVDQADLHPVADPELPGDVVVRGVGRAIDQLPAGVRRRRDLVDLDHVVLPLDPIRGGVVVAVPVAVLVVVAVLVLAVLVLVVASRLGDVGGQQLHAAARAAARLFGDHLGMHGAHVRGGHRHELHPAARAAARLLRDDLGVHGAGVGRGAAGGLVEVHLGDERERLVRLGGQVTIEARTLGAELRVGAQLLERLGQRGLGRLVAHRDRREPVDLLGRVVLERELAGALEEHVEDHALRRRQDRLLDDLLALAAAAVPADELHARPGQLDLEHARVGGVGQIQAHHLALPRLERELGLSGDEQHVAEAAHRGVRGLRAAERRRSGRPR